MTKHKAWSRLPLVAAAATLTLSVGIARAEPIPPDTLKNIHDSCVQACVAKAPASAAACETVCSCVAEQTGATMDREELDTLEAAISSGQQPSPELAAKAQAVQDRCKPH